MLTLHNIDLVIVTIKSYKAPIQTIGDLGRLRSAFPLFFAEISGCTPISKYVKTIASRN